MSEDAIGAALQELRDNLVSNQEPLGEEFQKVLDENYDELIESTTRPDDHKGEVK